MHLLRACLVGLKERSLDVGTRLQWQLHTGNTFLRRHCPRTHRSHCCNKNIRTDTFAPTGQHPEDAQDLLQGPRLQEAHPAQGHPVQGWQGALNSQPQQRPDHTLTLQSKASLFAQGKRRYDRKQSGYGGQTKPVFHKKAKTTKKVVLRLECTQCKTKAQLALKRCKHFELGYVTPPLHKDPPHAGHARTNSLTTYSTVVTRRPRVPLLSSRCVHLVKALGMMMERYVHVASSSI